MKQLDISSILLPLIFYLVGATSACNEAEAIGCDLTWNYIDVHCFCQPCTTSCADLNVLNRFNLALCDDWIKKGHCSGMFTSTTARPPIAPFIPELPSSLPDAGRVQPTVLSLIIVCAAVIVGTVLLASFFVYSKKRPGSYQSVDVELQVQGAGVTPNQNQPLQTASVATEQEPSLDADARSGSRGNDDDGANEPFRPTATFLNDDDTMSVALYPSRPINDFSVRHQAPVESRTETACEQASVHQAVPA